MSRAYEAFHPAALPAGSTGSGNGIFGEPAGLHSQGASKNGKGDDGDEPAEEGDDETEGHIIGFDLPDRTVLRDEDRAEGGDSHDNDRPAKNEPLEKIIQRTTRRKEKLSPLAPFFQRGDGGT